MELNKRNSLTVIIIVVVLLFSSKFFSGEAAHITDYQEDIARIVNNELDITQQYNQSSIDITSLTSNSTSSQVILSFVGEPVIDPNHGYRIIIDWNKQLHTWLIESWFNVTWEKTIAPKSNFTVCYAGGVSGFGVVNGSYSEFYNSSGSLLFSEVNNNSIIVNENSIIFNANQSLIPNARFSTFNETQGFTTYNVLIVTTYNTTETYTNTNGTSTISNVIWMDLLPESIIGRLFNLYTLCTSNPGIIIIASTIGFVGACQVMPLMKRKRKPISY